MSVVNSRNFVSANFCENITLAKISEFTVLIKGLAWSNNMSTMHWTKRDVFDIYWSVIDSCLWADTLSSIHYAINFINEMDTHWAHSEDCVHTVRMSKLFWAFVLRTLILLVLKCYSLRNQVYQRFSLQRIVWGIKTLIVACEMTLSSLIMQSSLSREIFMSMNCHLSCLWDDTRCHSLCN